MTFVDEALVYAKAGRGGNGSASMHSEPYKPHGGPDGGNGGAGGSVVFEVSRGVHDLSWIADHPHQRAAAGVAGRSAKRDGATGKDLIVPVPDGTVVSDEEGLIADLVGEGARAVVAQGGRGGRGNAALASARNRVPRTSEPGEDGEEKRLRVELRTVADVGLVGLPNAGKSTLLSRLSAAKPKIANYPFTTLTPNLGVAGGEGDRFVVADIPGLVEGAADGKGLGHRFLRHILRCRALVMVVDLSAADPPADLATLRRELSAYDRDLGMRRSIVAGTKADLVEDAAAAARSLSDEALAVSAVTGEGLEELLARLGEMSKVAQAEEPEATPYVVLRPGRPRFTVTREGAGWRVKGQNVERLLLESDLDDEIQLAKFQKRLVREGIERRLAELGASPGDEVAIGDRVFEFIPDAPAEAQGAVDGGADADRFALEEEAAWIELHAAFDLVPEDRFQEPRLTPEGWSPRDAMFHVGAWCAEAANQLERMRLGTYVDARIDIEVMNRAWFEISRELDVATVKAELHAARTRMRQEWCELGERGEMTRDAIEWFEESGHIHYRDHRRELLAWLDRI